MNVTYDTSTFGRWAGIIGKHILVEAIEEKLYCEVSPSLLDFSIQSDSILWVSVGIQGGPLGQHSPPTKPNIKVVPKCQRLAAHQVCRVPSDDNRAQHDARRLCTAGIFPR